MATNLTLISHPLCPYVQRAAIVLAEKHIPFERIDIDLANKPDWFLALSPLGKTPLLLVDGQPVFESAVICEYLEDTTPHQLHPADPLVRAQHRGWIEFASSVLGVIAGLYGAQTEPALATRVAELRSKFATLEAALGEGPYFAGSPFSIVDAAFGPVFRYFDVFDTVEDFGVFEATPKVRQWRAALRQRASVKNAVSADYPELLRTFLARRDSALSARMTVEACAIG
ncbi:glutathione S-transferase family protein [Leeia oryzae]|uniref:glutathione S-transferase family protein n=1 Tax=Leeia oryzae TaxID=356662 RepID=UPI0003721582|nr:glutathione S-transferase family protein [Leeia oryzae]